MEEEECNTMLDHLQQYVPHLEKLIQQLKDPKKKNRELQLNKLEGLHAMITDRKKKLKIDTLRKCEDVILKILQKVNPNLPKQLQQRGAMAQSSSTDQLKSNNFKFVCKDPPEDSTKKLFTEDDNNLSRLKVARARLSEICTPASPSPPRDLPRNHSPVLIPGEKIRKEPIERPDIYRLAAESLSIPKPKLETFATPVLDSSKLLSKKDLESLIEPEAESPNQTTDLSIDELESMREYLKRELDGKNPSADSQNKTAPKPIPPPVVKEPAKPKETPRAETVLKNPTSMFGDLLSNIDKKIWNDDKKEKRKSVDKKVPAETNETPPPVYKRLADKYNPRPRKPSTEKVAVAAPRENEPKRLENDKLQAAKSGVGFAGGKNNRFVVPPPQVASQKQFASPNQPKQFLPPKNPMASPPNVVQQSNVYCNTQGYNANLKSYNSNAPGYNPNLQSCNSNAHGYNSNMQSCNANVQGYNSSPKSYNSNAPNYNYNLQNYNSNTFQTPPVPKKSFRPFQPIDSNDSETHYSNNRKGNWYGNNFRKEVNPNVNLRDPRMQQNRRPSVEVPQNKYDTLYSNIVKDGEKFVSPLDSLYSGGETPQTTGKGYGFQKFRIPKKHEKPFSHDYQPQAQDANVSEEGDSEEPGRSQTRKIVSSPKPDSKPDFKGFKSDETSRNVPNNRNDRRWGRIKGMTCDESGNGGTKSQDESETEITSNEATAKEATPKEATPKETPKQPAPQESTSPETTAKQSIPAVSTTSNDSKPRDEEIIGTYLAGLFQNANKEELLSVILSSLAGVTNEQHQKKFKRIHKIVESDSEEEPTVPPEDQKPPQPEPVKVEETTVRTEADSSNIDHKLDDSSDKSAPVKKSKKKVLKRRRVLPSRKKETPPSIPNSASSDSVTETVGERTKRGGRKCRTELDMLHEDIKEMFIRDGILTASGKRMCRILKSEESEPPVTKLTEIDSDSPRQRARNSNPKVIIEKTDLSKLAAPFNVASLDKPKKHKTPDSTSISPARVIPKRNKNKPNYYEGPADDSKSKPVPNEERQETPPPKTKNKITKKLNKRKKAAWSLGVIKKKKRYESPNRDAVEVTPPVSEVTPIETPDNGTILVEPDVNYYFDPQEKSSCRICQFKGKFIVQHYKSFHPNYEVLISRIAPEEAKQAIKESLENVYDDVEVPQVEDKFRKRFTYQCRFCQTFFKKETTEAFFDHLTSHTGEYRYSCKACAFKTSNIRSLKSHYSASHTNYVFGQIQPTYSAPSSYHIVFGYACSECYFIQLSKTAIKDHMQIYHLGDNNSIHKISMSMVVVQQPAEKFETIEEIQGEIPTLPTETCAEVEKKRPVKAPIFRRKHLLAKRKFRRKPKKTKQTESKTLPDIIPKLINNLAAFQNSESFESDDLNEGATVEKAAEEEPVQTITPKRCSFNLLDIIKGRLEKSAEELVENAESTETPIGDKTPETSFTETIESVADSPKPESMLGNLKLKPLQEMLITPKIEEVAIQVGPVSAIKRDDYVLYTCNLSCNFATTIPEDFKTHCSNLHECNLWNRFCSVCDAMQEHCGFEVLDACNHLIDVHFPEDPLADSTSLVLNTDSELPFKIVSVETDEPAYDFPFLLTDFRTLTPDESEVVESPTSNVSSLTFVNTTLASGSTTNVQSFVNVPIMGKKTPPSLLPLPALPALVPVSKLSPSPIAVRLQDNQTPPALAKSSGGKKILLRDTPLAGDELTKDRKSPTAMSLMLVEMKLAQLYKCPEYNCKFSTDVKRLFEAHLNLHTDISAGTQMPCLYCNFKTELGNMAIHYDVRHSKCRFCCIYCFYRACNQTYVEMHQELKHTLLPRQVLLVPINQDALTSQANITPLPLSDVVPAFICACQKKFLFGVDIIKHAKMKHSGMLTCGYCFSMLGHLENVFLHMHTHNVFPYHCRYCLYGGTTTEDIQKHFSLQHFAQNPHIVCRQFDSKKIKPNESAKLIYDDDDTFSFLKVITHELFTYYTPSAKKEYLPLPTKSPIVESPKTVSRANSPLVINKFLKFDPHMAQVIANLSAAQRSEENTTVIITSPVTTPTVHESQTSLVEAPVESAPNITGDLTTASVSIPLESGETSTEETNNSKRIGLCGKDLFKCAMCGEGFGIPKELKLHIANCFDMEQPKPYKCAHCPKAFKNVSNLLDHLKLHSRERFACSLCDFKAQHQVYVRQHMKGKHKVSSVTVMAVNRSKQDYETDDFIIKPKSNRQKSDETPSKDSSSYSPQDAQEKTTYAPEEVDLLPFRPIFAYDIICSACSYKSKVKANLVRHMRLHLNNEFVPTSEPINPVPCLEKNEKMFDKMTNLSHSGYNSNSRMSGKADKKESPLSELTKEEQEKIPLFVPSTKRNVCGATGCDYLCLDDNMFKCHLAALHGSESFYKCKHCEAVLSNEGTIDVDVIIKHQKYHDLTLYKCKFCPYLHSVKHKVEDHNSQAHPDKKANVIVIREMTREPVETQPFEREQREEIKDPKPWRCGFCKFRCTYKSDIIVHVVNKHELGEEQYKCALCPFKTNHMSEFAPHFEREHSGYSVDVIDVYYKVEKKVVTDTTPISKFNRNLNFIRGIPVEESKCSKKSSPLRSTVSENLDKAIESVATGNSSVSPKIKTVKPDETQAKIKDRRKSLPISKKLKTLKEKTENEMLEVIEIEDDIVEMNKQVVVEEEVVTPKVEIKTVKEEPKIVKVEPMMVKVEPNMIKVEPNMLKVDPYMLLVEQRKMLMDLAELKGIPVFGDFGEPVGSKFLCPQCMLFRTSVTEDFKHHLFKELMYFRYICTTCRKYAITYKFLLNHIKLKHPLQPPESIVPISPDGVLEDWVAKVIAYQSRIINNRKAVEEAPSTAVSQSPPNTDSSSSEGHKCPHCEYSSRNPGDIRKHERRHWLQKPLKCGHCDFEGITNSEITAHSRRTHINLEPSIVSIPMPNSPTIKPIILRKRKRKPIATESPSDKSAIEPEKPIFLCAYCRKRCNTEVEINNHYQLFHPNKEAQIKTVLPSQLPKKYSVIYKCFYCAFISTSETIKDHFKMEHPTSNLSVFRYQCPYCNEYFRKLEKIKAHCRELHGDANPEHLDIKSPAVSGKQFSCKFCFFKCDQEHVLAVHEKRLHPKSKVKIVKTDVMQLETAEQNLYKCPECTHSSKFYPTIVDHLRGHAKPLQCFYCNARFIYPTYANTHIEKEHPGLPAKHVTVVEALEKFETLKSNLLVLENDVYVPITEVNPPLKRLGENPPNVSKHQKLGTVKTTARKSTTLPPFSKASKVTARKSTTPVNIPIIELDDDLEDEEEFLFSSEDGLEGSPPNLL